MKKWYVSAEIARERLYCGRVKTIVEADSAGAAIEAGRPAIEASLEDGMRITGIGCMDVDSAVELGDEETYARMRTV